MDANIRLPSLPLNSENKSLEDTPWRFKTVLGGSSVLGGENRGYTTSYITLSKSPPTQLSPGRGYPIYPPELNNEMTQKTSKRPRGRPTGLKNKPKPPIFIRENNETTLKPVLIEIPKGNDIVETIINLARCRNANITVLSGSGLVSEITLHHPMSPSPIIPIKGTFYMTSFFGTYVGGCGSAPPQFITNPGCSSFSIYLSSVQGQVFGGIVGGMVMSAGPVIITATIFKKPKFHKAIFINGTIDEPININGNVGVYALGVACSN